MGPIPDCNLTEAPAFYTSQVDLYRPYSAYSSLHKRTTAKIWLVIFFAVLFQLLASRSWTTTPQMHSSYHSLDFQLLMDFRRNCSVILEANNMKLNFNDLQFQLHKRVECTICPVRGHNMHGKVERKIRKISSSIEKNNHNERPLYNEKP